MDDEWRFFWDSFILLIAIWNSVSVPVVLSFEPEWGTAQWYITLEMVGNGLFMLDILVAFNTIFYDIDGNEVRSRLRIARSYTSNFFLIDLLSSIPFDLIQGPETNYLKVLSMLKLIRITKLTRVINSLHVDQETKAVSASGLSNRIP